MGRRAEAHALSADDRKQAMLTWWAQICASARSDPNVFIEQCFRNDQDPSAPPFKQQWFHREWQRAWTEQQMTVLHGATGFGKSDNMVGHLLWRIGRQPNIRIALLGKKADNAAKLLAKIKRQIETNETLRSIFPELRPGDPWSSERLRVKGAGIDTTTNTVEVYGLDGSPQGLRGDIIVPDDILDFENTLTEYQRKKTLDFLDSVIQSRLTTTGQLHMLANAWHPDDAAFVYAKRPGIWYRAYPAIDPVSKALLWPDFRPQKWLDQKLGTMSESQFARMFLCQPRDESTRIFKTEWILKSKQLGAGVKPMQVVKHARTRTGELKLGALPSSAIGELVVVVGCDLATGKSEQKRKTDRSVYFAIGIHPNGVRQVLWVEKGRWSLDEKLRRLADHERRYEPSRFLVEDNAMQHDIVQYAQNLPGFGSRVEPFTTSRTKWHESNGIEGIGLEMRAGRWIIPGPAQGESEASYLSRLSPEEREAYALINEWCQHLLDFSRAGHTDDDVMACVAPGALVTTRRGLVPIEQVVIGDEVLTHLSRWRRVTKTMRREHVGEAIHVRAVGGQPFLLTPEHPVWSAQARIETETRSNRVVPDGAWTFLPAGELRSGPMAIGHFLETPKSPAGAGLVVDLAEYTVAPCRAWGARWHVSADELRWSGNDGTTVPRHLAVRGDAAMLMGLYLAEGSIGGEDHVVTFSLHRREQHLVDFVRTQMRALFGADAVVRKSVNSTNGIAVDCRSKVAARFFGRFGARAAKCFPWELWDRLDSEARMAVARGWFMGDGCYVVQKGNASLSGVSISRGIIEQVQQALRGAGLLSNAGVFQKAGPKPFAGKPSRCSASWRISLTQRDTRALLSTASPLEREHWGDVGTEERRAGVTDRTNSRFLLWNGRALTRVAAAERTPYEGPVFNLHVEEDESYCVEGVAVHNCYFAKEGALRIAGGVFQDSHAHEYASPPPEQTTREHVGHFDTVKQAFPPIEQTPSVDSVPAHIRRMFGA